MFPNLLFCVHLCALFFSVFWIQIRIPDPDWQKVTDPSESESVILDDKAAMYPGTVPYIKLDIVLTVSKQIFFFQKPSSLVSFWISKQGEYGTVGTYNTSQSQFVFPSILVGII
jgi:hypothetical protein